MKNQTLGEFIIDTQKDFPGSTGELSKILSSIRLAAKLVSHETNKAGLAKHILGAAGSENIQGEQQQKLDVYANNQFIEALKAREVVCGIGSEENDAFISFEEDSCKNGKYVVLMDPLDGSSNIDVNVSIGTIFSVFENWGFNNNRAYLFLGFSILSVFMALFRRHFRKKYSNKN